MNFKKLWMDHLIKNNMTYYQHFLFAAYAGTIAISAGALLLIHAILPCFYQTTGSDLVSLLNKKFKTQTHSVDT